MAHYAYVNPYTNQVEKVLVIDKKEIKTGLFGDPNNFIECSYNQKIGKVFPGIGFYYIRKPINSKIKHKNVFVPPRPSLNRNFNESIWSWEAPLPIPNNGKNYIWSDKDNNWIVYKPKISIDPKPNKYCVLNEHYQWEHLKSYWIRKFKNSKFMIFLRKVFF